MLYNNIEENWLLEKILYFIYKTAKKSSKINLEVKTEKLANLKRKFKIKESEIVKKDWIQNLSSATIPEKCQLVLQLGPKFNCLPYKVNFEKIISEAELCIRNSKSQ